MADILRFPRHDTEHTDTGFLQDDEVLNFDTDVANGETGIFPFKAPAPSKQKGFSISDWSNQELATLFRVKRLLDTAGVRNEIDRGITDEGDPWFVFCNPDGDVFIHLCRIRNVYLLDSPNIVSPLSGRDFNELIGSFTRQKLLNQDDQPNLASHRLVRLKRDGQILMHPSTMLAALIWTVFLASEEIVMIIPDESGSNARLVNDVNGISNSAHLSVRVGDDGLVKTDDVGGDGGLEVAELDASEHTKFGQTSYAIGLTAIAISLGFMSETLFSDDDINTFAGVLSGTDNAPDTVDKADADAPVGGNFLALLGELLETVNPFEYASQTTAQSQDGNIADESGAVEASPTVFGILQSAYQNTKAYFTNAVEHANIPFTNLSVTDLADISTEELSSPFSLSGTEPSINNASQTDISLIFVSQIDETGYLIADLVDYSIGDLAMKATFDITSSDLDKTMELIETSEVNDAGPGSQPGNDGDGLIDTTIFAGTDLSANDAQAMEIIEYAFSIDIDLELIIVNDEIIFIDLAVLEGDSADTIAFSWDLSNGDTVSLIGLQSDFETLDLIA